MNLAGHFFKKTVADSNAPVQEKALDALIAYLRAADADAGRLRYDVFFYMLFGFLSLACLAIGNFYLIVVFLGSM